MSHHRHAATPRTYVVYVTYPGNLKEYAYLCNIPGLGQGDSVIANNTMVTIVRTADSDPIAVRSCFPVPDITELRRIARRKEIATALRRISNQQMELDLFTKVAKRSPEARKLLTELKTLL